MHVYKSCTRKYTQGSHLFVAHDSDFMHVSTAVMLYGRICETEEGMGVCVCVWVYWNENEGVTMWCRERLPCILI